jgi:tetratricopeptide (TPR) repeat protein
LAVYSDMSLPSQVAESRLLTPRALVVLLLGLAMFSPMLLGVVQRVTADRSPTVSEAALSTAPAAVKEPSAYEREIALSRGLLDQRRAKESLGPLERARRLEPEAFAVHNNLCVAHGILENRDEAVAACRHALQIDPKNTLAWNNLAWVASIQKRVSAAR